jgi:hypothetical protein
MVDFINRRKIISNFIQFVTTCSTLVILTFASVVPSSPLRSEDHRGKIALHHLLQWVFLLSLKKLFLPPPAGAEKGPPGVLSSQSSLWCQARKQKGKDVVGEGNVKEKIRHVVNGQLEKTDSLIL